MNELTIRGEVHDAGEVKEYGKNNFRKHEVVIKTGDDRFPNPIPVEFIKEAIDASTSLRVGQEVEIKCRLNGREWEKDGNIRYFPSVQGMEISFVNESAETGDSPF
jgi:single-strand DNA-binding protein